MTRFVSDRARTGATTLDLLAEGRAADKEVVGLRLRLDASAATMMISVQQRYVEECKNRLQCRPTALLEGLVAKILFLSSRVSNGDMM